MPTTITFSPSNQCVYQTRGWNPYKQGNSIPPISTDEFLAAEIYFAKNPYENKLSCTMQGNQLTHQLGTTSYSFQSSNSHIKCQRSIYAIMESPEHCKVLNGIHSVPPILAKASSLDAYTPEGNFDKLQIGRA